ncbi:Bacilysin biosynthesis oxidoreductase YwfH [Salinivirga cyanobacteriivorans]|uniref:Bacilysin biosynthesis oxidoreductase YwfH n=1 Tax=Salinivirga cyanobacteriivorans TaxID=1307839 RepID=A0A0S2I433_9BACT|nr:SDR family oxidoreductase [Salinivirga cyanobacteriivorans]ALO16748.1 Bacilysin biosynthesis oxidoreductase YwfH [Salinivirga cyanobacteriivorans]
MDLQIAKQTFIVCGATSGFGHATAKALLKEGATVIGIARHTDKLKKLAEIHKQNFIPLTGDLTTQKTIDEVAAEARKHDIDGILINSAGPPAKSFAETRIEDWDAAYQNLLRWKVDLTQKLIPHFTKKEYGRIVYIESASVKQPIENLVLSTSIRLAVVGMMKTLSQEISGQNITVNIIAPGSHETPAIERLIKKKSETDGLSYDDAHQKMINNIPAKQMGDPEKLGTLAAWLLSPLSEFVTGQVYALEGGNVKSTL